MSRETNSIQQTDGRYSQGGVTDQFNNRLGWWEKRILSKRNSDIYVIVDKGSEGRPDMIAYFIYGNPYFDWVVMQYNAIVDPVEEIKEGTRLRLPAPNRLRTSIVNRTTQPNVYT